MLVVEDKRKVVKSYKNNNEFDEANKQKDVREVIINKLNTMYDNLDK